jgi:hypothetical protein
MAIVQDKCATEPTLAAIVVVPDTYDTVRRTMSHLKAQTVAEQVEVILVAPSYQQLQLDESELACFHSWQVVEVGVVTSKKLGFIAGMRRAHAPIVALTEDHSFPDANWAEVLIDAHKQSWAVVGPSMRNGNPDNIVSRADFYQAYGEWAQPILSGSVRHLPGNNSSYKRDILLKLGDKLEDLMQAESILHRSLREQGYELLLESRTCTSHLNFSTWSSWIPVRYYIGRQFASTWAKSWPWPRRLLFTVASPLIPWVRLWRVQKQIRRLQHGSLLLRVLPVLLAGLLIEGLGHMAGFALGAGNCIESLEEYEYHRVESSEPMEPGTE